MASSSKISKKRKLESPLPTPPTSDSPLLKKKKASSKAVARRPSQIVSDPSDSSSESEGSVQVQVGTPTPAGKHLRFDDDE